MTTTTRYVIPCFSDETDHNLCSPIDSLAPSLASYLDSANCSPLDEFFSDSEGTFYITSNSEAHGASSILSDLASLRPSSADSTGSSIQPPPHEIGTVNNFSTSLRNEPTKLGAVFPTATAFNSHRSTPALQHAGVAFHTPKLHERHVSLDSLASSYVSENFNAPSSPEQLRSEFESRNRSPSSHNASRDMFMPDTYQPVVDNSESSPAPRAFKCPQCARSFEQIHKLNHHKRYHDRPHRCSYQNCEKRFGTKTHLDRHINDKHMGTKWYHCSVPDCAYSRQGSKSFPRKDNLRRHMMNKHNLSSPDIDRATECAEGSKDGLSYGGGNESFPVVNQEICDNQITNLNTRQANMLNDRDVFGESMVYAMGYTTSEDHAKQMEAHRKRLYALDTLSARRRNGHVVGFPIKTESRDI